jgi:predicted aconitase with swiveling domain
MAKRLKGEALVAGEAAGDLMVSRDPLSFWGGYDAATGEIIDRRHPLVGRQGTGCILAIPGTRGSSTTTAVLLESVRSGMAPAGFLVTDRDTFLVLASVVADEMYGRAFPVIRLSEAHFGQLAESTHAQLQRDGTVILT